MAEVSSDPRSVKYDAAALLVKFMGGLTVVGALIAAGTVALTAGEQIFGAYKVFMVTTVLLGLAATVYGLALTTAHELRRLAAIEAGPSWNNATSSRIMYEALFLMVLIVAGVATTLMKGADYLYQRRLPSQSTTASK